MIQASIIIGWMGKFNNMFCSQCGTQNLDGAKFCVSCGKTVVMHAEPQKTNFEQPINNVDNIVWGNGELGEKAPVEFWEAYKRCIDKYADFTGRASRSEFWKFSAVVYLLVSAIVFVFVLLGVFFDSSTVGAIGFVLASIVGLVHIVPSIAVAVRRLHDIGKSGWHILLTFIPIIGLIFLIIYEIKESQMVVNQYGPIPNLIFTEEEKAIAKKQTIIVLVLLIICSFW